VRNETIDYRADPGVECRRTQAKTNGMGVTFYYQTFRLARKTIERALGVDADGADGLAPGRATDPVAPTRTGGSVYLGVGHHADQVGSRQDFEALSRADGISRGTSPVH